MRHVAARVVLFRGYVGVRRRVAFICLVWLMGALAWSCAPSIFSHPGHYAQMDLPASLEKGQIGSVVSSGSSFEPFGMGRSHLRAAVTYGLLERLRVDTSGGIVWMQEARGPGGGRHVGTARLALQWQPRSVGPVNAHLSAGMGGGGGITGGFVAPDITFSVAIENRILIPYLSTSTFTSFLLRERRVDLGDRTGVATRTTVGANYVLGLWVPLQHRMLSDGRASSTAFGGSIVLEGFTDGSRYHARTGWAFGLARRW